MRWTTDRVTTSVGSCAISIARCSTFFTTTTGETRRCHVAEAGRTMPGIRPFDAAAPASRNRRADGRCCVQWLDGADRHRAQQLSSAVGLQLALGDARAKLRASPAERALLTRSKSRWGRGSSPGNEDGHAWTAAYSFEPNDNWRLMLEWLRVRSDVKARPVQLVRTGARHRDESRAVCAVCDQRAILKPSIAGRWSALTAIEASCRHDQAGRPDSLSSSAAAAIRCVCAHPLLQPRPLRPHEVSAITCPGGVPMRVTHVFHSESADEISSRKRRQPRVLHCGAGARRAGRGDVRGRRRCPTWAWSPSGGKRQAGSFDASFTSKFDASRARGLGSSQVAVQRDVLATPGCYHAATSRTVIEQSCGAPDQNRALTWGLHEDHAERLQMDDEHGCPGVGFCIDRRRGPCDCGLRSIRNDSRPGREGGAGADHA